jgi:cytochrome c-type biogenesis protein CcmH
MITRRSQVLSGLALALLLAVGTAGAIGPEPAFEDPALEAEYQALIREVRCLVCQNQTIADSTAPLAADLRREIRELMANGASREDVVRFLVDRYGDFVLYRPPVQPTTWVLWAAPAVLSLLGLLVFARTVRRRLRQPIDDEPPPS